MLVRLIRRSRSITIGGVAMQIAEEHFLSLGKDTTDGQCKEKPDSNGQLQPLHDVFLSERSALPSCRPSWLLCRSAETPFHHRSSHPFSRGLASFFSVPGCSFFLVMVFKREERFSHQDIPTPPSRRSDYR